MNPRSLLILSIVAAAAVIVCIVAVRRSAAEMKTQGGGGKIFESVPVNDSERLAIDDSKGSLSLEKKDGLWRVPARDGYPADFDRIASLLRDLVDMKAVQEVPGGDACLERFDLLPPEKKEKCGADLKVFAQGGREICSLRFGKDYKQPSDEEMMYQMRGSGAKFVFVPSKKMVFVMESQMRQPESDPASWLAKEFPKPGTLKRLALVEDGKKAWELKREKSSDECSLEGGIPAGKEPEKQAMSSASGAFSWMSFADVAGKAPGKGPEGLAKPKVIEMEDFDGFSYKFDIGADDDKGRLFVVASVDYAEPPPRVAPPDEKPEDKKKNDEDFAQKVADAKAKLAKWKKAVDGWIYLFEKRSFDSVLVARDKFLKAKLEEKKPDAAKDASKQDAAAPENAEGKMPEAKPSIPAKAEEKKLDAVKPVAPAKAEERKPEAAKQDAPVKAAD